MSNITRFGIDLAKTSFAVCGIDEHGKVVLTGILARTRLLEFFANQPRLTATNRSGSEGREQSSIGLDRFVRHDLYPAQ